jgi:HEAT repeat protein
VDITSLRSEELIALACEQKRAIEAVVDGEDDDQWAAYDATRRALHQRPSRETWELVAGLAESGDAIERAVVPDVLRYLGGDEHPFIEDSLSLFRRMLKVETDILVIHDVGVAFVDLHRPDAARELMAPFATHASASVRIAVVHALEFTTHADGIRTLIALSADDDGNVRNWATFFLGTREPDDPVFADPKVIEALHARIDDPHEETRAEAIVGLARRRDKRALPPLLRALSTDPAFDHYFEAAHLLASPALLPALEALQNNDTDGHQEQGDWPLSAIIDACRKAPTR